MCKPSATDTTLSHLLVAISGLARAIKDGVTRLNDGLAELQIRQRTFLADEHRQKIYQWLSSPDPSSNHNAACKKRQPTTGAWFVRSDQFEEWKMGSNSFLWLHGIRKYMFS
jgi:hypothetical protein